MRLLQQLTQLRQQQQQRHQHLAQHDFAWEDNPEGEPRLLPDTGAKDGLCGERWAIHAGRWAQARGHKATVYKLAKQILVHGVGKGAQTATEGITVPIGMEDTDGKTHLCAYRVAVVRGSDVPALLGINSLEKMNAIIRCGTGEIWFLDDAGVEIRPKGKFVHLQMEK